MHLAFTGSPGDKVDEPQSLSRSVPRFFPLTQLSNNISGTSVRVLSFSAIMAEQLG